MPAEFDAHDVQRLHEMILKQAMEDYVKLQHPRTRSKQYLQEAFQHAVDMLFDSTYRFLYLKNDDGGELSLAEMMTTILHKETVDLNKLRNHLIKDAEMFWAAKDIKTLDIPDDIVVDGHIYMVLPIEDDAIEDSYRIDYDKKEIYLNKNSSDSTNQEALCLAMIELVAHHDDVKVSGVALDRLGRGLFRLLRMNNCFNGDG